MADDTQQAAPVATDDATAAAEVPTSEAAPAVTAADGEPIRDQSAYIKALEEKFARLSSRLEEREDLTAQQRSEMALMRAETALYRHGVSDPDIVAALAHGLATHDDMDARAAALAGKLATKAQASQAADQAQTKATVIPPRPPAPKVVDLPEDPSERRRERVKRLLNSTR